MTSPAIVAAQMHKAAGQRSCDAPYSAGKTKKIWAATLPSEVITSSATMTAIATNGQLAQISSCVGPMVRINSPPTTTAQAMSTVSGTVTLVLWRGGVGNREDDRHGGRDYAEDGYRTGRPGVVARLQPVGVAHDWPGLLWIDAIRPSTTAPFDM